MTISYLLVLRFLIVGRLDSLQDQMEFSPLLSSAASSACAFLARAGTSQAFFPPPDADRAERATPSGRDGRSYIYSAPPAERRAKCRTSDVLGGTVGHSSKHTVPPISGQLTGMHQGSKNPTSDKTRVCSSRGCCEAPPCPGCSLRNAINARTSSVSNIQWRLQLLRIIIPLSEALISMSSMLQIFWSTQMFLWNDLDL